jgi:hypothetical protein
LVWLADANHKTTRKKKEPARELGDETSSKTGMSCSII